MNAYQKHISVTNINVIIRYHGWNVFLERSNDVDIPFVIHTYLCSTCSRKINIYIKNRDIYYLKMRI